MVKERWHRKRERSEVREGGEGQRVVSEQREEEVETCDHSSYYNQGVDEARQFRTLRCHKPIVPLQLLDSSSS